MKRRILWLPLLLTAALLMTLCLPAAAADLPPMPPDGGFGPPPEGGPGAGSAGQEFATFEEVQAHAGLLMDRDTQMTGALLPRDGSDFDGTIDFASHQPFSGTGIRSLRLTGGVGGNGIAINPYVPEDSFSIGGPEDFYEIDGEGYNTVIEVDAGQGNNDAGYEAVHGVGVAVNAGALTIENSYIRSEGPRSTPVYMFPTQATDATSLVVRDSRLEAHSDEIWMPPFKLLAGGARATLLMTRNNSWFYDSQVISNNWGAISQDSVDAMTYVVNSTGMSTEGGYGTYLTYGMRLYGSALYGGQYGVFMCGESDIVTDRGSAALEDAEAIRNAPADYTPDGRDSVIAAPCNAIVIHNSLPDTGMVAHGRFQNTRISTRTEDLPQAVTPMAADDPFFLPGVDIVGSGAGCGASYFFTRNLYGSLALVRSMNAALAFDGAETETANGVLVQSVVTYDPPSASGYLTPDQGAAVPGISASFLRGAYTGDVLHQDYQRPMYVTIGEGGTLTGKAVSGTWAAWNELWSQEALTAALVADGHDPAEFQNDAWVSDVQVNLIRPEDIAYAGTDNFGITLSVESGGRWQVTGESSLRSLTLAEGGQIVPPEGYRLSFLVGCDPSNDNLFYNTDGAEILDTLAPGTYENLVIRLESLPEAAVSEQEISEGSASEPAIPAESAPTPASDTTTPAAASNASAIPEPREPETALAASSPDAPAQPRRIPAALPIAGAVLILAGAVAVRTLKQRKS